MGDIMRKINRIDYKKSTQQSEHFEIVSLSNFFETRPKKLIESPYRLNFYTMMYILEGKGSHFIDFKEYHYKAGDVIILRKNQVHSYKVNKNVKGLVIHINEPFLYDLGPIDQETFTRVFDQASLSPIIKMDTSLTAPNRQLLEMIYQESNQTEVDSPNLLRSLFISFIHTLVREMDIKEHTYSKREFSLFNEYQHLVEKHYLNQYKLEFYEQQLGVSKKTINQVTRHVVDMSAKEFINQRVVLEIKRLLVSSELLIYEISDQLGFDEPANMTNFFKKYTDLSPREFRSKQKL